MNQEMEKLLIDNGASLVGFAKIEDYYGNIDTDEPKSEDSFLEYERIPHFPVGIAIVLHYPKEIIRSISKAPTDEYYHGYHSLNTKLDELAILCADYIQKQGYHAYPQTVANTREYGTFRTEMPHKTVAVNAGLGWIGKSALFITEKYGSAVRLTSVLTDAPYDVNQELITSKCGACMLCANACPGKAISGCNWKPDLERDEYFNAVACRTKAREIAAITLQKQITLCGKCIEVCPYTQKYTRYGSVEKS